MGKEQGTMYYDEIFALPRKYSRHYTASKYYPLWLKALNKFKSVFDYYEQNELFIKTVDFGCGPGQFADFLSTECDYTQLSYVGIDFSSVAIKKCVPVLKKDKRFAFACSDAFKADKYVPEDISCVFSFEFLEHVENDLGLFDVINRRRVNGFHTFFIGSVPDFNSPGHVRHFANEDEVFDRYKDCFIDGTLKVKRELEHYFLITGYVK